MKSRFVEFPPIGPDSEHGRVYIDVLHVQAVSEIGPPNGKKIPHLHMIGGSKIVVHATFDQVLDLVTENRG